jgi:protein SCO1
MTAAAALAAAAAAQGAVDPSAATAPRMEFTPPAAGSYRLQRIQPVTDAVLIDHAARRLHLKDLTRGKVTLLTFFYTECPDPLGCPYAYGTLHLLRSQLNSERTRASVRFVSVSLDPAHDTPQALARYAGELATDPQFEWRFLTAPSLRELLPLLDDFGQDVGVELDAQGRPTRALHHMLKMFLIDRRGEVREIYSLAFLQPQVITNDIRTLLAER